jgi:hypothetical protein
MTTPLEDSDYQPLHPPFNNIVPAVVAKWGKNSQLRWFQRFMRLGQVLTLESGTWNDYWVDSEHHPGFCCLSCEQEQWEGYGVCMDG